MLEVGEKRRLRYVVGQSPTAGAREDPPAWTETVQTELAFVHRVMERTPE
jgi:hypothetical protein